MIQTTCIIPPAIWQMFSSDMLKTPTFEFDEKKLWRIYEKIQATLNKRDESLNKKARILEQEFLEIYERIKKKKEELGPKARNKTKELFYSPELPDKGSDNLFAGLMYGGKFMARTRYRDNHEVQKVRRKLKKKAERLS